MDDASDVGCNVTLSDKAEALTLVDVSKKIATDSDREQSIDYTYMMALVGDSGVGKTSLIMGYRGERFEECTKTTIGVEFAFCLYTLTMPTSDVRKGVSVQIRDTAGQERFRAITSAYYRGVHAIMFVYAINDRASFDNLARWNTEADQNATPGTTALKILLGNKLDASADRCVPAREAADFAEKHHMLFLETSAKTRTRVDRALQIAMRTLLATDIYNATPKGAPKKAVALGAQNMTIIDPVCEPVRVREETPPAPRSGQCNC